MSKNKSSKKKVAQNVAAPEVVEEAVAIAEEADATLTETERKNAIRKLMTDAEFKLYDEAWKREQTRLQKVRVKDESDKLLNEEGGKFYDEYTVALEVCKAIEEKAEIAAKKSLGIPLEK